MADLRNLDIVYIVKISDDNESLRYSLRSVEKYFPHKRVVIVGYKPDWVQNVYHLNVDQIPGHKNKYKNIDNNWWAMVRDDEISEDFVLFNDDFFVLSKITTLPKICYGPIRKHIDDLKARKRPEQYIKRLEDTADLLEKQWNVEIESYELHMPMIINRNNCFDVMSFYYNEADNGLEWRSIYGNSFGPVGFKVEDCKAYDTEEMFDNPSPFLSTTARVFKKGKMGTLIREMFPEKSRYEV